MTKKSHKTYADDYYRDQKRKKEIENHIKRTSRVARYRATITPYQIQAIEILKNRGLRVEMEKAIQYKSSFFLIDVFLPDYNMCIEIDGDYHDDPEVQKADKIRDDYLRSKGYWVLRFRNRQIKTRFYQNVKRAINMRYKMIQNIEKNKTLA